MRVGKGLGGKLTAVMNAVACTRSGHSGGSEPVEEQLVSPGIHFVICANFSAFCFGKVLFFFSGSIDRREYSASTAGSALPFGHIARIFARLVAGTGLSVGK